MRSIPSIVPESPIPANDPRLGNSLATDAEPDFPLFAPFWRETFARAKTWLPDPELSFWSPQIEGFETAKIAFTSWEGRRIFGWFSRPLHHPIRAGIIVSHGYGGREGPDPVPLRGDAAILYPCARGLSLSADPTDPKEIPHVLRGIDSRDTYILRGCVGDIWAAASALLLLAPEAARDLSYVGSSFDGGIGALAIPWDRRFHRAFLGVPSFGNHPLRLRTPCAGSGEAVRLAAQERPELRETLRFYDASIAARHLHISVLVECAITDDVVPAAGQFSVFNGIPPERRRLFVRSHSHTSYPGDSNDEGNLQAALRRFLSEASASSRQ